MRICFLTPRFPYPPLKGDTLRVYHQLRALHPDHDLTLFSLADGPVPAADRAEIAHYCPAVTIVPRSRRQVAASLLGGVASRQPLQVRYYQAGAIQRQFARLLAVGGFDVVHVTLIRMLPYVWHLTQPPVLVDLIDSLALNLAGRRRQVGGVRRLVYELEYRRVLAYERAVTAHFPALVVSAEADKAALGGGGVTVIPNGVDGARFAYRGPAGRDPATLIFTGNMGYHPNEEAVIWFADAVWPLLRARYPALRWQIVGAAPTARVQALGRRDAAIAVPGQVADLSAALGQATVAVCPMQSGSGIQNKVLEALAMGTPVVATGIANRGVGAQPERDLLVADDAPAFAAAIARLLDEPATRARLSSAGRAFIEQHFSWDHHAQQLNALYMTLGGGQVPSCAD